MIVLWCLYDLYGGRVLFLGISLCLYSIVSFSGPIMLHLLVECAENNSSWAQVLFLLFVLVVSKFFVAILSAQYSYYLGEVSVSVGAGLKDFVFLKATTLSTDSRRDYSSGNIANLYTVSKYTKFVI